MGILLLVELLDLPLLIVGGLEGPHDTLAASLYLLDDSDCGFHVGVKGRTLFDNLLFGEVGLLEVDEELIHDLVALVLVLSPVHHVVARDVHLYLRRTHPHLQQKLVEVDVFRADRVGAGVVPDEVEFEFYHSQHGAFKHVLQEHPLLRVDHLVVAVFQNLVAVDVFDVKMGVEPEPLFVLALVLDLDNGALTPF